MLTSKKAEEKRNDNLSLILISILSIVIVSLSIYSNKLRKESGYYQLLSENKNSSSMVESVDYLRNLYENESIFLNPNHQVVPLENKSKVPLSSLVEGGSKLVLRIKDSDCKPCVDSTLTLLKTKIDKLKPENIIILTNQRVPRELILFLRTRQLRLDTYMINNINELKGERRTPYFFVLQEDLQVTMFHEVKKNVPGLTKYYLDIVSKKLDGKRKKKLLPEID